MNIAFISDIHFGKLACTAEFSIPGDDNSNDTKNAAAFTEGLIDLLKEKDVSFLFIAGDLTSYGSPQEFYYCEEKIIEIAAKANIASESIICTMGNHDIDWTIIGLVKADEIKNEDVLSVASEMYQKIASNVSSVVLERIQKPQNIGPKPFSGIVENEFVVFILNSSSYSSPSQYNKHGRLDKHQLEWLETELKSYENDRRTKIVMLHHHPIQYPYPVIGEDPSLLEEGSELISICGKYGVNMVLHGHRHHPRVKTDMENGWKNPITFICAGSLSVGPNHRNEGTIPNTVHIIDMSNAPDSFVLYNYEYSLTRGWIPLRNNRDETPIDAKMQLGKVFSRLEMRDAVMHLLDEKGDAVIIQYDELPEPMKFCSYNELNQLVFEVLSPNYEVCGRFPEKVSFIRKRTIE